MRAAVYARLSRPKDKPEMGANIADQESIGRDVVEHRGWALIDVFTDNGRSAYKDDAHRPEWERMLAAKPDVIVVRDEERLARNMSQYVDLLTTKARVVAWLDVETADADLDARLQGTDTDEFAQKIVGARSYSRKIGSKVKRKIKTKAAAGAWPHGGTRPFGYHHPGPKSQCCPQGTEGCKPGAIMREEADIIRWVARRWLAGESLSALCRDLTALGVLTPAGKPWRYARLRAMLAGPRVAGIRVHNGVETQGTWAAIVDADLHKKLRTAASDSMTQRENANGTYLLTSIVWCACGSKMYGLTQRSSKRPPLVRYVCRGPEGCGTGITAAHTNTFVANRSFLSILAPELRDQEQSRRDLLRVAESLRDLQARIEELDDAYWKQRSLTKDRWLALSTSLTQSLAETEAERDEVKRRLARLADAPETAEVLAERWQLAETRERNRLLRVGVERVTIYPRRSGQARFDPTRIEITFRDGRLERLDPDARLLRDPVLDCSA